MHTSYRYLRAAISRPRVLSTLSRLAASHSDLPRLSSVTQQVCRPQNRGKKTKSTLQLDELPQGVLPLEPLPLEEDVPAYPTVVLQARHNMRKFENCVLLTRVGGFYELYFEHAEEFGPLLNLKVAQKRTNAGNVPMVRLLLLSKQIADWSSRLASHFFNWTVISKPLSKTLIAMLLSRKSFPMIHLAKSKLVA